MTLMPQAIVDGCCFSNLYSTNNLRGFLTDSAWKWHVAQLALAECHYVRVRSEKGKESRGGIDAEPCIREGLITVVNVQGTDETELYVQLAGELDDGEAMGLSIAAKRRWIM